MTLNANRNYVELVFFGIAHVVVIFFCLFAAGTPIVKCWKQFACTNSAIDFVSGFCLFRIIFAITFVITFVYLFAFCTLIVSFVFLFAFFSLIVLSRAVFAMIHKTITFGSAFIKLGQWMKSFAFRTSFGYNWFRHGLIPYIKSRLEPVSGYNPVSGSLYNNNYYKEVK